MMALATSRHPLPSFALALALSGRPTSISKSATPKVSKGKLHLALKKLASSRVLQSATYTIGVGPSVMVASSLLEGRR